MLNKSAIVALAQSDQKEEILNILVLLIQEQWIDGRKIPKGFAVIKSAQNETLEFFKEFLPKMDVKENAGRIYFRLAKKEFVPSDAAKELIKLMKDELILNHDQSQYNQTAVKKLDQIISTYGLAITKGVFLWVRQNDFWKKIIFGPRAFCKHFAKCYAQARFDLEKIQKNQIYEI